MSRLSTTDNSTDHEDDMYSNSIIVHTTLEKNDDINNIYLNYEVIYTDKSLFLSDRIIYYQYCKEYKLFLKQYTKVKQEKSNLKDF